MSTVQSHKLTLKPHSFYSELSWLGNVIENRISQNGMGMVSGIDKAPSTENHEDNYANWVKQSNLNHEEKLVLILALAPHLVPDFYDGVIQKHLSKPGDFPQLGGVRGKNFRGFLPTGETALFILAGEDLERRFRIQQLFNQDHLFAQQQVLWLEDPPSGEPIMSGKIVISQEYVELFTLGKVSTPRFGMNFPAQRISTKMDWEDLVLPNQTMNSIKDLEVWVKHGGTLLEQWGLGKKLKPGYRVLFHGPPGTGKTLTASLIGKYTGKEVYKIDLSMVVSKYIGETERNLANLFDKAENKDWILFFDEADALFGKRTNVKDAHDKYANQEVSFLLQRTEDYSGLVILASNFKSNIDEAFTRRFQSHIYFPAPKYNERLQLWRKAFPEKVKFEKGVDFSQLARQYDLTGAEIMNVVQFACLQTIDQKGIRVANRSIIEGIKKEYHKAGKSF